MSELQRIWRRLHTLRHNKTYKVRELITILPNRNQWIKFVYYNGNINILFRRCNCFVFSPTFLSRILFVFITNYKITKQESWYNVKRSAAFSHVIVGKTNTDEVLIPSKKPELIVQINELRHERKQYSTSTLVRERLVQIGQCRLISWLRAPVKVHAKWFVNL